MQSWRRIQFLFAVIVLPALLTACESPVGVTRVGPDFVHQELTRNVLSAHEPSEASTNVLGQHNLLEQFQHEPEVALAALHEIYTQGPGGANEAFALSELSFMNAERTRKRSLYLASALYAYAFLFPDNAEEVPNPFDRRFRVACDLYNRGLTEGFKSSDKTEVELRAGSHELPFGRLEVDFSEDQLIWIDRRLEHFIPVAEVEVRGLRNRYRLSGIGAPLAAGQVPLHEEKGFQVGPAIKVPVTAVLRVDHPRRQLTDGRVHASLELHVALDTDSIQIGERRVPLEIETTSFLAYSLEDSPIWEHELAGFFSGGAARFPTQFGAIEPYRPGRFPVVFVHGTASSVGRWAEMLNELMNDPRIGRRFQAWFFTYDTGNPIVYSAMQLRDALQAALEKVDPEQRDAALQHMVMIGHSQGGLLTKLLVVDTEDRLWNSISRKPLEQMDISQEEKEFFRKMIFLKPVPAVRRVVFISTPHRGSFISATWAAQRLGGLVKMPGKVVGAQALVLSYISGILNLQ